MPSPPPPLAPSLRPQVRKIPLAPDFFGVSIFICSIASVSWRNSQDVLTACVLSATVALQALLGNSSAALMISCFWSRTSYLTFVCCVYAAVRRARLAHKKGQLSDADYEKEVNEYMTYAIKEQERIGVDVLVHGEPERSDM